MIKKLEEHQSSLTFTSEILKIKGFSVSGEGSIFSKTPVRFCLNSFLLQPPSPDPKSVSGSGYAAAKSVPKQLCVSTQPSLWEREAGRVII